MNILTLFNNLLNSLNKNFSKTFSSIEETLVKSTDEFTINFFASFLEYLDLEFKNSQERKDKYYVKQTHTRGLITSIGYISFKYTRYEDKETKKSYCFIRDLLNLSPYQRISPFAEYTLVKYASEYNMQQACNNALRNTILSRSTLSKKISNFNGEVIPKLNKEKIKIKTLYIEMDEIHANLQTKGNKGKPKNHVCPCAIVHEGYKEVAGKSKRKRLKNVKNFATAKYSYKQLWELIYKYVDEKYNIDSIEYIFISGDGAPGIKQYTDVFSKGIFVLDKFHYKKYLKYIFKDKNVLNTAIEYIENNMIDDFKKMVEIEIEKRPNLKDKIEAKMNYIINNLEGIKNQNHEEYKCPCSMESHVCNGYARYITSIPFSFCIRGLENKLKLLVLRADHYEISFEDFMSFKYGINESEKYLKDLEESMNIIKTKFRESNTYEHTTSNLPIFDNPATNNYLENITSFRKEIKFI